MSETSATMAADRAIACRGMSLGYGAREVVRSLDLEVPNGQLLVLLGPSGSGKTTLLSAFNASVPVRGGALEVFGQDPSGLVGSDLERFRGRIGFIHQSLHLVGRASVLHNVGSGILSRIPVPRALLRWYTREEYGRILSALSIVGLADRVLDRCDRLSGGQRQRVAIARALVQDPVLLLADEPISALDPKSARGVMEVLRRACRDLGITVVCSLHHLEAARSFAERVVGLNAGRVVYDGAPEGLHESVLEAIYRGEESADPADSRPEPAIPTVPVDPAPLESTTTQSMETA
jgi:phosphonate transport system ATP-binding protein